MRYLTAEAVRMIQKERERETEEAQQESDPMKQESMICFREKPACEKINGNR